MPRKRPASQPASQRMTAAELQRLHGGLLATAPYVDLSPYRLVKALAEQGIIITEPLARMWASKYRTPAGAERMVSALGLLLGASGLLWLLLAAPGLRLVALRLLLGFSRRLLGCSWASPGCSWTAPGCCWLLVAAPGLLLGSFPKRMSNLPQQTTYASLGSSVGVFVWWYPHGAVSDGSDCTLLVFLLVIWYWEYQLNEEFRKRYGLV